MRLQYGQHLRDLRVVGVLGEGATAVVYLVEDARAQGERRALKLLSVVGSSFRKRLRREAAAAGLVHQPNVVQVHELIDHDGYQGVLMEYIEGPTLFQWQHAHSPTPDEALAIAVGMLRGIGALHEGGLVHRDLKPSNIMLAVAPGGGLMPKLVDFGLVKDVDLRDRMTVTGVAMGTPTYMPPEQLRDASRVDQRADLYSLGCILFEMLCGSPPFARDDWWGTYQAVERGVRADLDLLPESVPPDLRELIGQLLEPDPDDRPSQAAEVLQRLQQILGSEHPVLQGVVDGDGQGAAAARDLSDERRSALRKTDLWPDEPRTSGPGQDARHSIRDLPSSAYASAEERPSAARWVPMALVAGAAVVAVSMMAWVIVSMPGAGTVEPVGPTLAEAPLPAPSAVSVLPEEIVDEEPIVAPGPTPVPAVRQQAVRTASVPPQPPAQGLRRATSGGGSGSAEAEPVTPEPEAETVAPGLEAEAATPELEAEAEADEPAIVVITGGAHQVELQDATGASMQPSGPVPPGTYTIRARFSPGEPMSAAGSIQVGAGQTATVHCDAAFLSCSGVP